MKQVLIKSGKAIVEEIPAPLVEDKNILVKVAFSCVSIGTEVSGLKLSSMPLYKRALKQPENVKKVLEMVKAQGVKWTMDRVSGKLASGSPTGYSVSGVVIAVGASVDGYKVGDRVACGGAGIANHAEIVSVPVNLAVKIPNSLGFEDASSVTIGAIAMQGVRRANPTLGETVAVIGLGLLGQITVQLLKANGCKVIGIDLDNQKVDLALRNGMDKGAYSNAEFSHLIDEHTERIGTDAVIITASSGSDSIVSLAMKVSRKKGRVVLVGDVGLALRRADFYVKELDFFISSSYGPGRYDPYYEIQGNDYPIGYVRWTENRNMAEYLYLLEQKKIQIASFYKDNIYSIDEATKAFDLLKSGANKPLMVLLQYDLTNDVENNTTVYLPAYNKTGKEKLNVAVIGAGSFALGMHLPNMQKLNKMFSIHAIMSRTGSNAKAIAMQYKAQYATTDIDSVLQDKDVDMVMITTRHNLHAEIVAKCIESGKKVFVEKPLAVNQQELEMVERAVAASKNPYLVTGFNRRFAPIIRKVKAVVENRKNPMIIEYRMNAGFIPKDHWVQTEEGAGRNIGEACHIYDLFNYLTNSKHVDITAASIDVGAGKYLRNDNFTTTIKYADGSICTLIYTALGDKSYPKEEMTIFCDGSIITMSNFEKLNIYGHTSKAEQAKVANKGQFELLEQAGAFFLGNSEISPLTLDEQFRATQISFIIESLIK